MTAAARIENRLNRETVSLFRQARIVPLNAKPADVTYSGFLSNKMQLIQAIRAGLPYSFFELVQEVTPFTDEDWAEFLDLSTKSLQRYKASGDHLFRPIHSEKILELAEVTQAGLDVFGDMERLRQWLNTPSYALGRMKPMDLLRDSYGKELVMAELVRISYGILS